MGRRQAIGPRRRPVWNVESSRPCRLHQEVEDDLSPIRTSIHCAKSLRDSWPDPLADHWRVAYPQLFDDDDLRLTVTQGWTHFWEWFAAVHVYETTGAHSLVEKYGCRTHPGKLEPYKLLLSEPERAILDAICGANHVQSPDLLIYEPDMSRYWFAEVKGPGDRVTAKQRASHDAIERELGVQVEIIRVVVDEDL